MPRWSVGAARLALLVAVLLTTAAPNAAAELPAALDNFDVVSRFAPVHPELGAAQANQLSDVTVHDGHAYLTSSDDDQCEHGGTFVVDIRNPAEPKQVAFLASAGPYWHGDGPHARAIETPQFSGDLLAVPNRSYGSLLPSACSAGADTSRGGFDLYDVSDPANAQLLVRAAGDKDRDDDPATPPDPAPNSVGSVFVWQQGATAYLAATDDAELADIDIFDISDPRNPQPVASYDLPAMFPAILAGENARGSNESARRLRVRAVGDRRVMLAPYFDAGFVQLDVTDPSSPQLVNDTRYTGEDPFLPGSKLVREGNAHSAELSSDAQFVLGGDEDLQSMRLVARSTSGATRGRLAAMQESDSAKRVDELPDETLNGPSRFVGDACDPDTVPPAPSDDGNAATEDIALVERGGTRPGPDPFCGFAHKFATVKDKGWDAVVVFNNQRPDDTLVTMTTGPSTIPGAHVRRGDALGARGILSTSNATPAVGTTGPKLSIENEFDGWGYAHLFDAGTGEELDTFAIPEARLPGFASGFGELSISQIATDATEPLAYATWREGGVRALRFSREGGIDEVGRFVDEGGSDTWGIEPFTTSGGERLLAASDRDRGLVVLRYTGPGAPAPPSCADSDSRATAGAPVTIVLSCTDANGNPLTRRIVEAPGNGTLGSIAGDQVTYTPNAGFTGTDQFRFVANDGAADSGIATARVAVAPPPSDPPRVDPPRLDPPVIVPNQITASARWLRSGRLRVTVRTLAPGTVRALLRMKVGRRTLTLARASRSVASGTTRFTIRPSAANRRVLARVLRRARRGRKQGTLVVRFAPSGGSARTVRRVVTLRRA